MAALERLELSDGRLHIYPAEGGDAGYVSFQVVAPLSHDGVIAVQHQATALVQAFIVGRVVRLVPERMSRIGSRP